MKIFHSLLLTAILLGPQAGFAVDADMDATVLKVKVFKFAVSNSKACTNPVVIFSSTTGVEEDLLQGPTFGSGAVDAGTYPCVMLEVSKVIKVAGSAGCAAQVEDVICNGGNGQTSQLIDGTAVACLDADPTQKVVLYITTASPGGTGNGALLPPTSETDTTHGIKLDAPFVVSGDTTGTFKMSKRMLVTETCETKAPSFTFE